MDLRQIKCFVALVEEGSITGAARRLNVVQPAVSMSLRKLEDEFGVVLFDRTARGVVVSQKARGLYEICLQILAQVAAAAEILRSQTRASQSMLTVGSLPSGSHGFLPKVLSEVCERHPECRVFSRQGFNDNLLDHVSQGMVDIAIVSTVKQNERLPHEYLGTERLMVVSAPGSDLEGMKQFPASMLNKRKLVLSPVLRRRFEDDFARAGIELKPMLEVETASGIFGVLKQSGWFSVLPASALCGSADGEFSAVPVSEPVIERDRWIVRTPVRPISDAGRSFRSVVRKLFGATPNCQVAPDTALMEDSTQVMLPVQAGRVIASDVVDKVIAGLRAEVR